MSNSNKIFLEIVERLLRYTQFIEQANRLNLTDEANHAEDIFSRILNLTFSLNLVNTNLSIANSQTIDLVDIDAKTSFQITSNKNFKSKKDKTVDGFYDKKFKGLSQLCILFITSKHVSKNILDKQTIRRKTVECFNIDKLLKLIKTLTPSAKKKILQILVDELDILEETPLIDAREISKLKNLQPQIQSEGLIIERTSTVKSLYQQATSKNTLLIGLPGIGKTFLLNAFNRFCWDNNSIAVTIKVNELHLGTNEELNELLKVKDWFTYLDAIKHATHQFLVFDAFDTAKDDVLKSNILSAISKCIKNLSSRWHIIVSVRTYDAQKSIKLQQIFSGSQNIRGMSSYTFEIPILTDEELEYALNQDGITKNVYQKCTKELKKILHIPYFLKLYEFVLKNRDHFSLGHLEAVSTEEELLSVYWKTTIKDKTNHLDLESTLTSITLKMFDSENLNVPKSDILSSIQTSSLAELISDGILIETGVGNSSIAYSHNILFDFAISNVLKPSVNGFISQIEENTKRPFIYRASYVYLVKRIWKEDRDLYWTLYFKVFENRNNEFKIIHQIIFNSVLSISYEGAIDIKPLIDKFGVSEYEILVRKLLDIVRFSISEFREAENVLVSELTQHLTPGLLWHIGFFLNSLFRNSRVEKLLTAKSALAYFHYILISRSDVAIRNSIDYYGGNQGISSLIDALKYLPEKGGKYVEEVLNIINEEDFPINYFSSLTDRIDDVARINPELAAKIFRTVYLKTESSSKETRFGSGVVVGFRSTRGQDFRMCHHSLEEFYPEFLQHNFKKAVKVGLEVVNAVKGSHFGHRSKPVKIKCGSISTTFKADGHIGDWEHDYEEGAGKLLRQLFEYLKSQVSKGVIIDPFIEEIIKGSKIGFVWANLFRYFKRNPTLGVKYILPLLCNEIFLVSNETAFEGGEWIKASIPFLSKPEIKSLEKIIIGLLESSFFKTDDKSRIEYWVAQTLSCIPPNLLTYAKSKNLAKKHKGAVNTPIISHGGPWEREDDDEDFIKRNKINITRGINKQAFRLYEELKVLIPKYEKVHNLKKSVGENLFKLSTSLYELVQSRKVDVNLKKECGYVITEGLNIASRLWKILSKKRVMYSLSICKDFFNNADHQLKKFDRGANHSVGYGYSERPRISCSNALVNFSNRDDVPEVRTLIEDTLNDNSVMVRINAVRSLFFHYRNDRVAFWRILNEQLKVETDDHVIATLLGRVNYRDTIKNCPTEIDFLLQNSLDLVEDKRRNSNALKFYVSILLGAVEIRNSEVAKSIISRAHFMEEFISDIISKFFDALSAKGKSLRSGVYFSFIEVEINRIIDSNINAAMKLSLQDEQISKHFKVLDYLFQKMFFSFEDRKLGVILASDSNLYEIYKPMITHFISRSKELHGGFMVGHTGYYISQILEKFIPYDPEDILGILAEMVALASKNGFTSDKSTLEIIIRSTELYLTDFRDIVLQKENFSHLLQMLNYFAESGWQEALELIWRLNEIF